MLKKTESFEKKLNVLKEKIFLCVGSIKLLADVKAIVDASKKETGTTIKQPGIK